MTTGSFNASSATPFSSVCGAGWVGTKSSKNWSGANQSNWRAPLQDHQYTMNSSVDRSAPITWAYTSNPRLHYTGTVQSCFGYPDMSLSWPPNSDLQLQAQLIGKIRRFAFNAAVAIAEGSQTLSLLTNSVKRLDKAMMYTRKRDIVRAARQLRCRPPRKIFSDVSSNWLELQYGWRPLLSDIYGAANALADQVMRPYTQSYKAQIKHERQFVSAVGHVGLVKGVKRLTCRMSDELASAAALGLLNPEQVLWEKIPYSFIADWVYPIGTWLEIHGTLRNMHSAVFQSSDMTVGTVVGFKTVPGSGIIVIDAAGYRYETVSYSRSAVTSNLRVPLPQRASLKQAASWQHAVSAVALCAQRFSKVPSKVR